MWRQNLAAGSQRAAIRPAPGVQPEPRYQDALQQRRGRERRWCDRQSSEEMRVRLWGGAHPWASSGPMPYTHYLLVALPLSLGAGEWGPTTQCSGVLPQDQKAFFPSEPCPSPAPWPWVSHEICLGYSFLVCMLGTKPVLVSQGCCKV